VSVSILALSLSVSIWNLQIVFTYQREASLLTRGNLGPNISSSTAALSQSKVYVGNAQALLCSNVTGTQETVLLKALTLHLGL
jgi:hypothetical protein